jgi:hypothetical protein
MEPQKSGKLESISGVVDAFVDGFDHVGSEVCENFLAITEGKLEPGVLGMGGNKIFIIRVDEENVVDATGSGFDLRPKQQREDNEEEDDCEGEDDRLRAVLQNQFLGGTRENSQVKGHFV